MLSNYCVKSHLEQFTHCEALILTNVHVVFELKLSILEWLYCVPWSEKNYAFLAYTKYTSIERIFFGLCKSSTQQHNTNNLWVYVF